MKQLPKIYIAFPSFFFLLIFAFACGQGQQSRQIQNLTTFAKLYGYVRFFHPSDEAAELDWDRFAVYGVKAVENATDAEDLRQRLEELFLPVAPTLKLYTSTDGKPEFNLTHITPDDTSAYKTIAWQHVGVGFDNNNNIYRSVRINRPDEHQTIEQTFGTTGETIDAKKYRGKAFVLSARLKIEEGPGNGHLWARADIGQRTGFFDNMDDRPVEAGEDWATYEVKGKIDEDADRLVFGIFLSGKGKLLADDLLLRIKEDNGWTTVHSNPFGKNMARELKELTRVQTGYQFNISAPESDGNTYLLISDTPPLVEKAIVDPLFSRHAQPGEYIDKQIGSGLSCILPLALYGTEEATFPKSDEASLKSLREKLRAIRVSSLNGKNRYTRLADLVIIWNVFQHFYPYFDVVDVAWDEEFRKALSATYADKTDYDFLKTLQKFTAPLKDGHVYVSAFASKEEAFLPPIEWEWIENKLVITHVMDDSIPLSAGDIVTSVNGEDPADYFKKVHSYISAATQGYLEYRARTASLMGSEESSLEIEAETAAGAEIKVRLVRNLLRSDYGSALPKKEVSREIAPGIFYLNLDAATNEDIEKLSPKLEKAKGIICDLRGYPKSQPDYITHLLHEQDTSSMWMRIPQIIYPDQENITGYRTLGWNMSPQQPHLDAEIVFITDGRAISYAESYLSFIEHYSLATIVGQSTAGTNGNINPFVLPGGFRISWTGMKVLKHDGSRLHGVGITPDVYVEKTIAGVREGRDEFLEKAIGILTR